MNNSKCKISNSHQRFSSLKREVKESSVMKGVRFFKFAETDV